jgi:hypothetical protein
MAATLRDSYNTNDDAPQLVAGAANWFTQTFTPSENYTIEYVKLLLYKIGTPGTITISIKATDGSGKPTGADLASGTIAGSSLLTSPGQWETITFGASYALISGTKYAIVARQTLNVPNWFAWRMDQTSPTYTGGSYGSSANSGSTWTMNTARDFMFETWGVGSDILPTAPGFVKRLVAIGNNEVWVEDI